MKKDIEKIKKEAVKNSKDDSRKQERSTKRDKFPLK
jgi:hypothetical protein